jgi:hypothetical protein
MREQQLAPEGRRWGRENDLILETGSTRAEGRGRM